ncbi:hypothetical protein NY98_22675 [Xanthomonas citri pv. fuscans]|uniref:Uncharacterized protein n=1 Tax=Xanthomonas citri pv. fuscans TaxID=366649 RepID=A0AB34SRD1_XANCI|nr:hypothetical protein NB99_11805 [Xanthomonas citri pv. fuscans]KGP27857.1 hypothetical protein NY65_11750 [Xanthomonas phaseoli pv. phaseoli]KKW48815.1 hypothetical protein NY95_23345 [Xanthomonas citri pv. fuscans]KKW48949.1 hypothetical protein NY98_22675 [Xanthomonas citri pv. fuscans]KKY04041.1 hypothetical protein NY64_23690 [Xanthomonas citri pv. fuscans]
MLTQPFTRDDLEAVCCSLTGSGLGGLSLRAGIDASGNQSPGLLSAFASGRQSDIWVHAQADRPAHACDAVIQAPAVTSAFPNQEVEAATVPQRLVAGFGLTDQ